MTIKQAIEQARCRKGTAYGTTKTGAFWLANKADEDSCGTLLRSWGGDGIGQSAPDLARYLQLRHYRNGDCKATIYSYSGHQNRGHVRTYNTIDGFLDCTTVEQAIVVLKASNIDGDNVYGDKCKDYLSDALSALGLPASEASPDE